MSLVLLTPPIVVIPRRLLGALQLAGQVPTDLIGPILVYRGDDAAYLLTVTDDAGARVDLRTLSALECQVKAKPGAADPPTIATALGAGIDLLDQDLPATRGQALITFTGAATDQPAGLYALDVVGVDGRRTHLISPRDFTIADVVNGR